MEIRYCDPSILYRALSNVNEARGYQLAFDREPEQMTRTMVRFTIKSPSGVPGSRYTQSGRRLAKASWHAHGYLFDEILRLNPDAVIKSGDVKISKEGGNWNPNPGGPWGATCPSDLSILGDKEDARWTVPPDERDPNPKADPALAWEDDSARWQPPAVL